LFVDSVLPGATCCLILKRREDCSASHVLVLAFKKLVKELMASMYTSERALVPDVIPPPDPAQVGVVDGTVGRGPLNAGPASALAPAPLGSIWIYENGISPADPY